VEQWPAEASDVSKTKENRSLEGHKKTKQDTPDDNYVDGDNEEADGITYTETNEAPIGVMTSEDNGTGNAHKSDAEAENNPKKIGENYEEPSVEVDNTKTHDGDYAHEHIPTFMKAQDDRGTDTTIMPTQPNPHTDDEEDAKMTSQPIHTSLEAG
jgi:hypothetical protein